MSALNGGANGISGSNGVTAATDKGCWTIGLINSKYKYLSAETFGFRTNANGKSLKKKQVWILEPSGDGESVVLRSHLNKYLAVDQFGNVTADQVCQKMVKDIFNIQFHFRTNETKLRNLRFRSAMTIPVAGPSRVSPEDIS